MEENLNWRQSLTTDDSIKRFEYREYEPYTGSNLNGPSDIRIAIQNQDEFLLPSRSYLYIEGSIRKKDDGSIYGKDQPGTGSGAGKDLFINLINNGIVYLFDRVDYQLGNETIEGYSNPGQASTMKSLLTYPLNYSEGMNFMWGLDKGEKGCIKNNTGYEERHNYLFKNSSGNFSVAIPLNHIFGFCENYNKVIYGVKHQLTLRRGKDDDNALLKSPDKNEEGIYKVPDGKVIITKIIWRIPHVMPTDEYMIKLSNDIQNKITVNINFLNRQCESIAVSEGRKQFDWRLNVTSGAVKPRYIVLAFQTDKDDDQVKNTAIFNHCSTTTAYVQLNSERYPEMDLQLDFEENKYTTAYKMLCDYFNHVINKESCPIALYEFRNLYPLLVFDVSRQSEKLKNSVTDIKIKATFKENIPKHTYAYALVLSDRLLKLQSDGNKMNFVY